MASQPSKRPSQVILWSQGRTACHLLERMLSKQPNTRYQWHPYVNARSKSTALFTQASTTATIPQDTRGAYLEAVEQGTAAWTAALEEAEAANQILFTHEHPQFPILLDVALSYVASDWKKPFSPPPTNFTMVPDNLMLHPGTIPILTFKNPIKLVPHAFPALRNVEANPDRFNVIFASGLRWQRSIYAWYKAHGISPIVVEAEDYMSSPEFVKKICTEAGLDPEAALFKWERFPDEARKAFPPRAHLMLKTLWESEGLRPELARKGDLDVDVEEQKWKSEYGEEVSKLLREVVDASMDDYEFLKGKKLMP